MQALRSEIQLDYKFSGAGTLRIFRDSRALERAWANSQDLSWGVRWQKLSSLEVTDLEPALTPIASCLRGGLFCEQDESGDAYLFCCDLADRARQSGTKFLFNSEVANLEVRGSSVDVILHGSTRLSADRIVLAAGSSSSMLCRTAGINLPVQPAKGYSVTLPGARLRLGLRIPIIDDQLHAVVAPLGDAIRAAGMAEFSGNDLTVNPTRVNSLLTLIKDILPEAQVDTATAWCGLRPMTSDGVPIIGPTSVPNLWINTGHGHLGWTQAAGSAALFTDLLSQRCPAIDARPFRFARFAATSHDYP